MKKLFLALIILLLATPAMADYKFAENWNWKNTVLEGAFVAASLVDLSQSFYIVDHPVQYYEGINFLLPKHPTREQFYFMIGGITLVHAGISLVLPMEAEIFGYKWNPRLWWQTTTLVLEVSNDIRNACIGIGVSY
jgi:hypothetical protein